MGKLITASRKRMYGGPVFRTSYNEAQGQRITESEAIAVNAEMNKHNIDEGTFVVQKGKVVRAV